MSSARADSPCCPTFSRTTFSSTPARSPLDKVELPSENFLLHFTGKQDAIVMGVFENRNQDVRVTLAGKGNARAITGSEIDFGKKGSKIWVAVLEGPGMWHSIDVGPGGRQEDHAARLEDAVRRPVARRFHARRTA